jgi:hypothetical protein
MSGVFTQSVGRNDKISPASIQIVRDPPLFFHLEPFGGVYPERGVEGLRVNSVRDLSGSRYSEQIDTRPTLCYSKDYGRSFLRSKL